MMERFSKATLMHNNDSTIFQKLGNGDRADSQKDLL